MTTLFLSIVIPAYNEEKRILPTLQSIMDYLEKQAYPWEVIVVDDGSIDTTAELVEEFASNHKGVHLIRNPHRGKGYAVKTGMLAARGEYRFLCDADLSMPIEQLSRFIALGEHDVAIGSREVAGARRIEEPAYRHIMGRVFNWLVRLLAVPGIRDTQCGFKGFRATAAKQLFPLQRLDGFGFDVEILFLAQKHRLRIVEVPIDWYYNKESRVHPIRDTLRMLREILSIRWKHWRKMYDV
ncbi:MAG: glycosyltransferase family 2 protein [Chloroflexi bacterium]|nr:glycosyltransferase family 2 protein [Chloroflexota bacterium]